MARQTDEALTKAVASPGGGLLVCLMADGQALQLVEHAHRLHRAEGMPWQVLYMDTVAARYASAAVRQDLDQALAQAQKWGAELVRVSLNLDTATHILSTIVHQARLFRAAHLLLGNRATGLRYWANFGERLSDFSEVLAASLPRTEIHILVAPGRVRARAATGRSGPAWRRALAPVADWGMPLLVLLGCTAVSALISPWLHPINLLLIYLVGVLYVALRRGPVVSVVTVLSAVLLFDWIFVAPRWSLKPAEPEYAFTLGIMLGVGLLVSRLAGRTRDASMQALAQAHRAQALSLLAQSMAQSRTPEDICTNVAMAVERFLQAPAQVLLDADHPANPGDVVIPLTDGGECLGRLVVRDLPDERRCAEDMHFLHAFADQAAVALQRHYHERRSAEAAVEAEAERLRNTLLAGISHDFRTPLTTIIGAASTVLSQGAHITVEQRDVLARNVLEQAQRLQALTSDLLDLARLQDGAVRPQCEWCPAEELVQEGVASVEAALGQRHLRIDARESDVVWCDARLVGQVIANLVLNAAQHSPDASTVHVAITMGADRWTLSVRDEGQGLAPGQAQAVFKKFHRAGDHGASKGTGLGLAICEAVARLHGGGVSVRNEGGAVFEVWFPQPAHPIMAGE